MTTRSKAFGLGSDLKVGVIGVGVVGGAVAAYFEGRGASVFCYDKFTLAGSVDEVNRADIIFICVPTPYRTRRGLDLTAVEEAISVLQDGKIVVLKSTSPPGTTAALQARYPQHNLFFNPEFLREKSAEQDFLEPDRQLIGYCGDSRGLAAQLLDLLPRAPYEAVVPATSAEMIKMLTNSYLALRVIFSNEVYDLAAAMGVNYDDVREGIAADPRIGGSHFNVFDGGYRGYGGKCLPKDMGGIIDFAAANGSPLHLLETAHRINGRLTATDSRQSVEAGETWDVQLPMLISAGS